MFTEILVVPFITVGAYSGTSLKRKGPFELMTVQSKDNFCGPQIFYPKEDNLASIIK